MRTWQERLLTIYHKNVTLNACFPDSVADIAIESNKGGNERRLIGAHHNSKRTIFTVHFIKLIIFLSIYSEMWSVAGHRTKPGERSVSTSQCNNIEGGVPVEERV